MLLSPPISFPPQSLVYKKQKPLGIMGCLPHAEVDESSVWLPASAINPPVPGLSHDDFRRAHDEFRGMHHDYWSFHEDFVMMFVLRVPVPSASRKNASGGGRVMMPLNCRIFVSIHNPLNPRLPLQKQICFRVAD
jgi:hypothetical protein